MAATPSLKIVKSMLFEGQTRDFSNTYHFNGGTPADATHWHTLMDNVTAAEKAIYRNSGANVTIIEAIGYAAGSAVPVATKSYSLTGTLASAPTAPAPGDAAALGRWATTARTTKNHPVYLFNYWHGALIGSGTDGDTLFAAQATAILTYMNAWISGFSDGTITAVRAGPNGATATGALVDTYIRHRDFPR